MLESFFDNVADLKVCNFTKKRLQQIFNEYWEISVNQAPSLMHNSFSFYFCVSTEALAQGCSIKLVLKKILRNSQEDTCVGVSFFNKVAGLWPGTLLKRDSNTSVFLWILWNFWEHLFWRTSANICFCSQHGTWCWVDHGYICSKP